MPPKMVSFAAAPAPALAETMRQIYRSGFVLIPLGGQNGKRPLIAGWNGRPLPLDTCLRRMAGMNSTTYGIRLDGLLVVDCDTDNDVTRALFAERFLPTPFVVQTGRGTHHYYRHDGLVPAAIRGRDIAIDFKAGSSAFVVGPASIRPDGKTYRILRGHFGMALPHFEDRGRPAQHLVARRRTEVGQRNSVLWQRAIEYAPLADDYDGLLADLAALRNIEFEDPVSVPDSELMKVAAWAWKLRLEGRLWSGRNSEVKINRLVLDALLPLPCGSEAYSLYSLLIANHGHRPAKPFAVAPDAIKSAGLLNIGRRQLYRAIGLLLELRLLTKVRQGGGVGNPSLYRLQSPTNSITSSGEGGRVYSITFSSLLPPTIEGTSVGA